MSAEEKTRISGDAPRSKAPILPVSNADKAQSSTASIHPAFYVM